MRLVFTNADQETFDRYRSLFVTRVVDHARRERIEVSRWALETILDFKYGEPDLGGDGLLARWHGSDVAALLLDWLPREDMAAPLRVEEVRSSLLAWVEFLRARGWYDPRSDEPGELVETLDTLADAYRQAVANPAEHRVSLFLQHSMVEAGYDPEDPDQVAEFEAEVESGGVSLDEELMAAIASGEEEAPLSPLSGPGRTGYTWRAPRLLEGAALAEAIEATPTMLRLREQGDDALPEDSVEAWLLAYEALGEALAERLGLDEDDFYEAFGSEADEFVASIVTTLFIERLPLPGTLVSEVVAEMGDPLEEDRPLTDEESEQFDRAVGLVLGELEGLGAVARETTGEEAELAGEPVFRLTPLGEWIGFDELVLDDYTIRTFDELMAEDAEVLVERAAAGEPFSDVDLDEWIGQRGTERAMRELVEVARRTDDCTHRGTVRAVTAEHPQEARPVYEELRADGAFGPQARAWLFDAGFLKEGELEPADLPWVMVDGVAAMARMNLLDEERLGELPVRRGGEGASLLELAPSLGHPETTFLLSWLGDNHPDPGVRKEARTALFRYQSGGGR